MLRTLDRRMRARTKRSWLRVDGYSLAEILVASTVLATVGLTMGVLFNAGLRVHQTTEGQDGLGRTVNMALLRMKTYGRESNRLFMPSVKVLNAHALAFASMIDEDEDGLFNEDPPGYINTKQVAGILGVDDDGDGTVDEGNGGDDDEDGRTDEDPVNGVDDDGDGAVDEDAGADVDYVQETGVQPQPDDDGDGATDEDPYQPIVYLWKPQTKQLVERHPIHGESLISENVEAFDTVLTVMPTGKCLVSVYIRVKADDGRITEAKTEFFMRNGAFIGSMPAPVDPGTDPKKTIEAPLALAPPDDPEGELEDDDDDDDRPANPRKATRKKMGKYRGKGKSKDDDDDDDDKKDKKK